MKKKSPPYAIIGAALLGLVAIFALFKYKQGQDAAATAAAAKAQADNDALRKALADATAAPPVPPPVNTRKVFYATQPVAAGAKISSAFYEKKDTPNDILPGAYSDASFPGGDLVGFYAIRNIEKGDPLSEANIGKTLPYLSQRISPGMRAVALPIFTADANNTGGFAVDDDKVDLLFSLASLDNTLILRTETVMQNVKVLYVPGPKYESEEMNGLSPAPGPGQPVSITFEVTPEQAQALVFMTQVKNGRFSMILRSRPDIGEIKIKTFVGTDYVQDFRKLQTKIVDPSLIRVQALATKIAAEQALADKAAAEAKQKQSAAPGTTNETPNPIPPVSP